MRGADKVEGMSERYLSVVARVLAAWRGLPNSAVVGGPSGPMLCLRSLRTLSLCPQPAWQFGDPRRKHRA
ncbi:hypothetical protein [Lysobacter gummosus]|uniref:hypothetical protein n=1 Tax=Lysobacter gummosus TaxID=262324 RepID=UPI00363BDB66